MERTWVIIGSMEVALILIILVIGFYFVFRKKSEKKVELGTGTEFSPSWRVILKEKVLFYNSLTEEKKTLFEKRLQDFLIHVRITGIQTELDDTDRVLVAASAVIPVFNFPNWKYTNLTEVLIYPDSFNQNFETAGDDRNILGMVGTGYMEGKMILSKEALHHGFENESDKKNTAIHEFVHLIDKMDGEIDGVPSVLLEKQYTIPWLDMMKKGIEDIAQEESDINPYGATNNAEFFAVASEYFFERPKLLARKHPELYAKMEKIFNQDMDALDLKREEKEIGRNDPCPCGSGKKFKKCCGKDHY